MIATVALLGIALRNTRVHSRSLERINILTRTHRLSKLPTMEIPGRQITHLRCKQDKKSTSRHKTKRTITEVSPWNDQLNKITGGLKLVLHDHNLTLSFCRGKQHYEM